MRLRPVAVCGLLLAVISVSLISQRSAGQSSAARSLITVPIDESKLTLLKGNTHPLARAQYDRGPASASLPMERMLLVLKSSPEQVAALQTLLAEQTDKTSPNYHKWLTPQEFGEQFGVSDDDLQKITTWLGSHGFQSIKTANGRNVIEFSGTAGQVQSAFHTAIHSYLVNGKEHFANSSDPSIPTALTAAVAGVLSLNSFGRKPMNQFAGTFRKPRNSSKAEPINPQYTFTTTQGTFYAVGPQDFATIYNVTPLWNAGITGSGETIAIISDSNINLTDVAQFRSIFDLPSNTPNVILNGTNPGLTGDEVEAIIDVEWSGAVAKNATIDLVVSASTTSTFGGDLSAEYIIDKKLAPILSESYGACERALGTGTPTEPGTNAFYNSLWSQGASEGITIIIASGDNGSATCDNPYDSTLPVTTDQAAQFGLAVSGLASTPYNVAVGGTDFNQITSPSLYWNTTNTSGTQGSAKGYIPETTWNDTCTNAVLGTVGYSTDAEANCNDTTGEANGNYVIGPDGGGGGVSTCTAVTNGSCSAGYPKPSWQTGMGVPADGKRDIPDISLFAGNGFAGSFYVVCEADQQNGVPCNLTANGYSDFLGYGGTSVSTQVFAGIVALIDQKAGGPQGNLNPAMYALAATQSPANCNSDTPASGCIFYDVTIGTNSAPCVKGTLNCTTNNSNDTNGILTGYTAGTGYDLTTGLGSVNAFNLATGIAGTSAASYALSSGSPTVTVAAPGDSGTMSATLTGKNGFSGTVTFGCSGLPTGATCSFNPSSATLSATATTAVTMLTVNTTAPSSLAPAQRRQPAAPASRNTALAGSFFTMLAIVVLALSARSRQLRSGAAFALLIFGMAGLMLMSSCGGTSGGGGGGGGSGGTPTGSTTATITGSSGSATSSLNFTLDVQ